MNDFNQQKYSTNNKRHQDVSRRKITKLGRWLGVVIIIALISLVVINSLGWSSTREVVTSYETITREFSSPGLIIRDEVVTSAPRSGQARIKIEEGTRVGSSRNIIDLQMGSDKKELYNYEAGVISYQLDGLETDLRVDNRDGLTYEIFNQIDPNPSSISEGERISTGEPVFKTINNFHFYLAVLLPQDKLIEYGPGDSVEVIFPQLEGAQPFNGEVDQIITDKPKNVMLIELSKFIPDLINLRKTPVRVIKDRYHGLTIPKEALVENEAGDIGVRVQGQIRDHFKEVEILHEVEEQVIIDGVLPGVEILID